MQYEIEVTLKPGVLDPEARALFQALKTVGHDNIKNLKISKKVTIEVDSDSLSAEAEVEKIAQEYLTNPVYQTYKVEKQ